MQKGSFSRPADFDVDLRVCGNLADQLIVVLGHVPFLALIYNIMTSLRPRIHPLSSSKIALKEPPQFRQRLLSPALYLRDTSCELCLPFPCLPVDHSLVFSLAQLAQHSTHSSLRILGVGNHVTHDHFNADTFVGGMPAVVVGRHAHERISDLGFAEKRRFGVCRHVDDATRERRGAVEDRFGSGGELRPLFFNEIMRQYAVNVSEEA